MLYLLLSLSGTLLFVASRDLDSGAPSSCRLWMGFLLYLVFASSSPGLVLHVCLLVILRGVISVGPDDSDTDDSEGGESSGRYCV